VFDTYNIGFLLLQLFNTIIIFYWLSRRGRIKKKKRVHDYTIVLLLLLILSSVSFGIENVEIPSYRDYNVYVYIIHSAALIIKRKAIKTKKKKTKN